MSGIYAVVLFLLWLVFTLVIFSLWLRFAIHFFKISRINPLAELVYKISSPLTAPLQGIIQFKKNTPYDWYALIVILLVEMLKVFVLTSIAFQKILPLSFLLTFFIADLIIQPCNLLFYLILIEVINSWINTGDRQAFISAIKIINRPFLNFGRKIIPDTSGFDFSPFVILLILTIITLFIQASLPARIL